MLASDDPRWLADGLQEAAEDRLPPWWTVIDVVGLMFTPFWLLTRLRKKRRVFPRR